MLDGISNSDAEAARELTAYCYKQGKLCPWLRPRPVGFTGSKGLVVGINCFDWSSMGMRYGWLGWSAEPYMEFCREALLDDDLD